MLLGLGQPARLMEALLQLQGLVGRVQVGMACRDFPTGCADQLDMVPALVDGHHGFRQRRHGSQFGKVGRDVLQLLGASAWNFSGDANKPV